MLWELERHGAPTVEHARVFVVENPAVIASAAALLRGASPPLVCVEGVPTTAAVRLLGSLREHGVELRFIATSIGAAFALAISCTSASARGPGA